MRKVHVAPQAQSATQTAQDTLIPLRQATPGHSAARAGSARPERRRRSRAVNFHQVDPADSANLVYFSSVSENTKRFVEKLGLEALRIPLHPRREGMIRVREPYVLIIPTYGGGDPAGALPKQVGTFLNDPINRSLLRAVIPCGNTNFGQDYCLAGPVISAKCQVPELYRFELLGTQQDVVEVTDRLRRFWDWLAKNPDAVYHQQAS